MVLRKAFKFKLRFKDAAAALPFYRYAGSCRFIWNTALALQIELLEKKKRILSYEEMARKLLRWKKQYPFLKDVPSQALQQRLMDLDKALREAFDPKNPKKFPRFKKKYKAQEAFRYPQGFEITKNRIYLPKVGWVRFFKSREIEGKPKNVTVTLRGGAWFISVQTEMEMAEPIHQSTTAIGVDFGIKRILTLSDGMGFLPINALVKHEYKLKLAQRKLSRQVKKSSNWHKQKRKIQKIHVKIADIRSDWLHRISSHLSKNHALIVLEDLSIKNMSASAKGTVDNPGKNVRQKAGLNKAILDQGWGELKRQIEYKQEWRGGMTLLVDPAYTSQECSACGHISPENRPSQELFYCKKCGHTANADENAAKNVLSRAGHCPAGLVVSNGAVMPSQTGTETVLS